MANQDPGPDSGWRSRVRSPRCTAAESGLKARLGVVLNSISRSRNASGHPGRLRLWLEPDLENFGVVPARGLEPRTLGLKDRCSTRLSYAGMASIRIRIRPATGPTSSRQQPRLHQL